MFLLERHAAAGKPCFGLHGFLTGQVTAPHGFDKAGLFGHDLFHFVHGGGAPGAVFAVLQSAVIQILGQSFHCGGNCGGQIFKLHKLLFAGIAADQHALAVLDIAGADFQANRHALHFPLGKLPAGLLVGIVQLHAGILTDFGSQFAAFVQYAGFVGGNGNDDHLHRGNGRGQDQTVVIAVGHDDSADQTSRSAPAGLEGVLQGVVAAGKCNVIGAAELIAKIVAGAALQGFAVLHHGFDGIGSLSTGKLFLIGLAAFQHGDAQIMLGKVGIAVQLLLGLSLGLLGSLVDGVAFLPPELTGAQERASGFFPANHAAPLIVQHRQVTVRMQHMAEMVAEHRFAGGAHSKALFQRVRTACSDPGNFGGKAVYQLALLFQQAFGDQHRHGHVFVAGCLKAAIQNFLDVLPDCIAIGAQHNKALDAGIFNQLCLGADIRIPLCEINFLCGDCFDHFFLIVCHWFPSHFLTKLHASMPHYCICSST